MSSNILILAEPLPLDRIRAWAAKAGLACTHDIPVTDRRRSVSFGAERVVATWISRAGSPLSLLVVHEEALEALRSARDTFAIAPLDALIDRVAAAAATPIDRIRAAFDLGALVELVDRDERKRAIEALGPLLADDDRAVRYAVGSLFTSLVDRRAEALLVAAAERHEDMAPVRDWVRAACDAEDDGTLYDAPTDSWWELERRAREGAEKGQWKRVAKAASDLLKEDADNVAGLYYRGLAYEAEGDLPMALAYLGAARAERALELSVDDEDDDEAEADDREEKRALLATIERRIEEIRAKEIPAERWAASREALIEQLAKWWKEESSCAAGAVEAMAGIEGDLEALVAFVGGAYENDVERLRLALSLAPGSLAVELRLAAALGKSDKPASREAYERVLGRLRAGDVEPMSRGAALIARVEKAQTSLSGVLEELASAAYQAKDRPRAIELADELVQLDPDSIKGWQLRGHARLFELQYADAAEAYAVGIREIGRIRDRGDSIFFGDDPRAMMHFNRCCAFGRLGMKEEALDALRLAVRANDKYAEEAKTEDWIDCLWGMPEFEAITRQEPRGLVTRGDLDEAHVASLIQRCKSGLYRGERKEAIEAGERAILLAEMRGDANQETDALSALAFALAFSGSAGRAVEMASKAIAIADRASPELRSEAHATHAAALHAHGDLEGAARAHLGALDRRREAYGEAAPVLAKSYGELARLYGDMSKPDEDVCAMVEKGIAVLATFLEGHEAHDDSWAEAITDRATLEANLAQTHARSKAWTASLDALAAAATSFEAAAQGTTVSPGVLENAHALANRVVLESPEEAPRAREIASRLEGVRFPGPPAVRRERAYWASLRGFVGRMRSLGAEDAVIADVLQKAARGTGEVPEVLRDVPEIASFAGELAARGSRWPTFLVMSAMALDLASTDLDGALRNLEELAVGYALDGTD